MPRRKRSVSECYSDFMDDDSSENGQPIQRNAANARERARMRVLSSAFCRLKTKLPWVPADTKLSKLDTLRLAKGYIQQLEAILAGEKLDDNLQIATGQHHNLSWPFIFQTSACEPQSPPQPYSRNGHRPVVVMDPYPSQEKTYMLQTQNQFFHATLS